MTTQDKPGRPPAGHHAHRASGIWRLAMLAALLIAAVIVATFVLLRSLNADGVKERQRELENLALTLAEQTARAIQSLVIIQGDIIDQIETLKIDTAAELATSMGTQSVHQMMREKISGLPYLDAITLIDQTGRLINFSRYWPIPAVIVSDRDYFKSLSTLKGPPMFISEPVPNRGTGTLTIYLAHRFTAPDGHFLGLVLGAMEQSYFERFYSTINLGADGLIALVRNDGALLARSPESAGVAPRGAAARHQVAGALFGRAFKGRVAAGTLDAEARIAAVHQIGDLPLAVVVSDSTRSIGTIIWGRLMPIAIAAGLLCLTIALVSYSVARHILGERAFADAQHAAARKDPLTGLPNRLAFGERMEMLIAAPPAPAPFALFFLDLDYFKSVNDTLGHDIGDSMLTRVADRISRRLGPDVSVARLGGDEFAIVHENMADDARAIDFAEQVIRLLQEPYAIGAHRIAGGCSVGIALFPRDGEDLASLLKNADLALYRSKTDGRGIARVFQEEMERSARERRQLELELHAAWRDRQLYLVYQPIFEATSGTLAGFEALARWKHPQRGNIPPDVFIPVAEETGLILPIGAWALMEACHTAAYWPSHLFVSVNLSAVQFRGTQAFHQVRAALDASGLSPDRLEIEITESTLLHEGPAVRATLDQFREEGITISLDDFGTGYSSLKYLQTLRIGRIKVDRSFVAEVEHSSETRAIVHAITSLAQALSLMCTAEGIETEAQRQIMLAEGCSHLQGFLLGRPGTAEDALRLALADVV